MPRVLTIRIFYHGEKNFMDKMLKKTALILVAVIISFLLIAASFRSQEKIAVFAGSAGKPALEEAAIAFEEKTQIKVELIFGGSGTVLSQMKISKSGDVYIPGSPDYMAKAFKEGVVEDAGKIIAYLVPAIIVQKGNPKNIKTLGDLAKPGVRVGIADPNSVCVGQYAVEILKHNLLYEDIAKNIVVYAESCSKTASIIAMGNVDAVIGWDVFHSWNPDKTEIIYIEPYGKIPKLAYIPASVSKYAKNRDAAKSFINFLISGEGQKYFKKWGYVTSEEEAKKFAPDAVVPTVFELLEEI
jgi:molybdate transport system substrate-binding protein